MQQVKMASPLRKALDLDGDYDPVVAAENEFQWELTCKDCGKSTTGTVWDLQEEEWSWSFTFNHELMEIASSEAICGVCNGCVDQAQKTLEEVGQ
jgi:hypothetical protein